MIDSSPEDRRKTRIAAFRKLGLRVFPALNVSQASSRCKPGRFDLIIAVAEDDADAALALCDQIAARDPRQAIALVVSAGSPAPERSYAIIEGSQRLYERVEELLGGTFQPEDTAAAA